MLGYLPQAILLCLIVYDLLENWRTRGSMRKVSFSNTAVGWAVIVVLLVWSGLFL